MGGMSSIQLRNNPTGCNYGPPSNSLSMLVCNFNNILSGMEYTGEYTGAAINDTMALKNINFN